MSYNCNDDITELLLRSDYDFRYFKFKKSY